MVHESILLIKGDSHPIRLLRCTRLLEVLEILAVEWEFCFICCDIFEQRLILTAVLPCLDELIRGARDPIFVTRPRLALTGRGQGGEEVSSCLALRTVEAHSLEETLSFPSRTKVDLSAFVKNSDLVKTLEQVSDGNTPQEKCSALCKNSLRLDTSKPKLSTPKCPIRS